ncbi:MAG TPA: TVP38/TMEM64 family protein [Deltaproteobacteria bacterium]|nr:TVP38/TMEM64 family protein [Deltaproteobacteria bacterium]
MNEPDPIETLATRSGRPVDRRWRLFGALVVLFVGSALMRRMLGIEWSAETIRALVSEAGIWAPITFVALLVFRLVLVIPSIVLLPAGGLLFGAFEGSVYGAIGLTLSGLANYGLVKWAGANAFQSRISPRFHGLLELARSPAGAGAVAIITGYPVGPIGITHFGAAIAGMGFMTFLLAVATGSIVRSATFSFFGASFATSDRLLQASLLMLGAIVIPLVIPRSREWLRRGFGMSKKGSRQPTESAGDGTTKGS